MTAPPGASATGQASHPIPEVWAGVECSFLRIDEHVCDQLALTGHDRRAGDLERLAALGVRAVRYPVLWGRGGGDAGTDWHWADARLAELRRLGIQPIVGLLHHGSGPPGMSILDPAFPRAFAAYAARVARRYPEVRGFVPVNEPLTTARFAGLYGLWHPAARHDVVFVRLLLAQCLAARDAARAIRQVRPDALIVQNEDGGRTDGTSRVRSAVEFDNRRRWLTFDLLTGRVDRSHPLRSYLAVDRDAQRTLDDLAAEPTPPDVLGIDYYVTSDRFLDHRITRYPAAAAGGNGRLRYADVELVRCGPFEGGFTRALRDAWERYGLPVALSEVHLSGHPSDQVAWWWEAWHAALAASADGIPVHHVTAWSAFGSAGWASLLRDPAGGYEPGAYDVSSARPRLTPLGRSIRATAEGRRKRAMPVGWWQRPDRILYPLEDGAGSRLVRCTLIGPARRSACRSAHREERRRSHRVVAAPSDRLTAAGPDPTIRAPVGPESPDELAIGVLSISSPARVDAPIGSVRPKGGSP